MLTAEEKHAKFLLTLDESDRAVFIVTRYLRLRGFSTLLPPITRAKSHAEWRDYTDDGDFFLSGVFEGEEIVDKRCEVKHLSTTFNGTGKNWPWPNFMVCSQHSYDNAKNKPWVYFIVSKDYAAMGRVFSDTRDKWWVQGSHDSRYGPGILPYYRTMTSAVRFMSLGDT